MRGARARRICILAPLLWMSGAVVNVLIAWACVIGFRPATSWLVDSAEHVKWVGAVPNEWPQNPTGGDDVRDRGRYGATRFHYRYADSVLTEVWRQQVTRAGWPLDSLERSQLTHSGKGMPMQVQNRWAYQLPRWVAGNRATAGPMLPLRPLGGFVVGSCVYAGALGCVLIAAVKLRRAVRRRAGRCVECDYTLTGLRVGEPCPECGAASAPGSSLALRAR